MGISTSEICNT